MMRHHYRNICTLLQYLRSVVNTPKGDRYNHNSYGSCTFGFAAQSGLFPELGWELNEYENLRRVELTTRNNRNESYSESSELSFGHAYTRTIVSENSRIKRELPGNGQLRVAIDEIEKFLIVEGEAIPAALATNTPKAPKVPKVKAPKVPNPATAGKRILARIARMEKVVADIEKLGVDAKHFTVHKSTMQDQITQLRDALAS